MPPRPFARHPGDLVGGGRRPSIAAPRRARAACFTDCFTMQPVSAEARIGQPATGNRITRAPRGPTPDFLPHRARTGKRRPEQRLLRPRTQSGQRSPPSRHPTKRSQSAHGTPPPASAAASSGGPEQTTRPPRPARPPVSHSPHPREARVGRREHHIRSRPTPIRRPRPTPRIPRSAAPISAVANCGAHSTKWRAAAHSGTEHWRPRPLFPSRGTRRRRRTGPPAPPRHGRAPTARPLRVPAGRRLPTGTDTYDGRRRGQATTAPVRKPTRQDAVRTNYRAPGSHHDTPGVSPLSPRPDVWSAG